MAKRSHRHSRGAAVDLEKTAVEFQRLANRVEKFLHRPVIVKLGLVLHFDPLPTRADLLKSGGAEEGD